jgi:hypothetical protein
MSIFEDFLAAHKSLPSYIVRNLELIGLLDSKLQVHQAKVALLRSQYIAKRDTRLLQEIQDQQQTLGNLADEKLTVARQLSEAVVGTSQRLSSAIKTLEGKVRVQQQLEETPQKKPSEV